MRRVGVASATLGLVLASVVVTAVPASAAYSRCDRLSTVSIRGQWVDAPAFYNPNTGATTTTCSLWQTTRYSHVVQELQFHLANCYPAPVAQDGYYGPQTVAAVKAVQREHGLDPDGVYGPKTRDAMRWKKQPVHIPGCI
ncbi:peptidoglycan-binding domain-containing protein [Cellulomonas sp. Leaf334]|uniref:peptidoglycan-binding domain-containing protein n=1 Tax=Cellulomonas sp. Leaf334 TaxID=1736339 RepID=UPI001910D25B|nr:peptidoglycan-binding domain-containing protein [Cellulomonas sp. Leaf334]